MSGAELIPDLSVIVHRLIIKWWLVQVKEIVGGESGLKVFLDLGLVDWIKKIEGLTLSPVVRDEKVFKLSNNRFDGCVASDTRLFYPSTPGPGGRHCCSSWQRCEFGSGINSSGQVHDGFHRERVGRIKGVADE